MSVTNLYRNKVVVTGATGFLGTQIVDRLLTEGGTELHLVVRNQETKSAVAKIGLWRESADRTSSSITLHNLDLTQEFEIPAEARGAKHVFHCAGLYDMSAPEALLFDVNVKGTENLLNALSRADFKGVFHHVSTLAVAGDYSGKFKEAMFDEKQNFKHPYSESKYVSELRVREERNFETRIYRPAAIMGDSNTGYADRFDGLYYMLNPLKSLLATMPKLLPLPLPRGLAKMALVTVDFAANSIVDIAMSDTEENTFHITDGKNYDMADIVKAYVEEIDPRRTILRIESWMIMPMIERWIKPFAKLKTIDNLRASYERLCNIPTGAFDGFNPNLTVDASRTLAIAESKGRNVPTLKTYAKTTMAYFNSQEENVRRLTNEKYVSGRKVVVTGASSGIGESLAYQLSAMGAEIVLVSRTEKDLNRVADQIQIQGGTAHVVQADLGDRDSVANLIETIKRDHSDVTMLFNNAGVSVRKRIDERLDRPDDLYRTAEVNYLGPACLMLGLIPLFKANGQGHIINSLSTVASYPVPRFGAYSASKAALGAWSQVTAIEYMADNIYTTDVYLPLVRTRMIEGTSEYQDSDYSYMIGPEKAASDMLLNLSHKPREVNFGLKALPVVKAAAPDLNTVYLNAIYRMFPDDDKDGVGEYAGEREILGAYGIKKMPF
ncbi:hypothetical protein A3709_20865 [Halioglobus sp. HI00S01]|uniref:SDR family NAD(P)-dependent oxidoreductase n=1 Tax=Halioglobus sp. HI00S01 TaxID=1822214 RepID=UPI0007C2869D|nr:SDR family NAD(P)-dependent oxidoreductase [Halioglobus sp. HI00S01]KZX58066.1 hypothetical protein A3709_20865 [Halioglobus sp. HI00S01]